MFADADNMTLLPDGKGFVKLVLEDGGETRKVRLTRLFPLSGGESYIRMSDACGKEIGIIKHLNELRPESRGHALQALEHFYIIPRIVDIIDLYDKHGSLFWEADTDKGRREFIVRNRHRDISLFPSGKMVIRDTDDNQYEIENYNRLSPKSRKLLEPWL